MNGFIPTYKYIRAFDNELDENLNRNNERGAGDETKAI